MATPDNRTLASVEYNLLTNTVSIAWREGDEKVHRGAYPVDEVGEVDDRVKTILGRTLHDIMGAAGASAQSRVDGLLSDLERSQQAIDEIGKENNFLKHLLNEAVARTDEVNERRKEQLGIIHQLQQENDDLKAAFANKKPE
jgi:hypothetical protein